jgi:Ca2+-transporting ATPase
MERKNIERSETPAAQGWHARSVQETLQALGVGGDRGLDTEEATRRLQENGPNRLHRVETRPWWHILIAQFQSIVVYLLAAAAAVALLTRRWPEGIAVVAVILVNAAIGFLSEWKAVRSMAALRRMGDHTTRVLRDGRQQKISAPDLVSGDIVLLSPGDLVPADLRLVEAESLRVNEAALTGESVPADKSPGSVDAETALADRRNMLYKGTTVADGKAVGVAVGTGSATELGRIAQLVDEAEANSTPLQERLNRLGQRLAWLTVGVGVMVALVGLLIRHQEATLVVETALALGIAAIPEGLPIVATIALARGMYLMAKRNALVNRLTAVETLGATTVIFSDKTGTLTENRMRLRDIVTPGGTLSLERGDDSGQPGGHVLHAARTAVLCNAASLDETQGEDNPRGDPTEIALLAGASKLGIERSALLEKMPEAAVHEFEPRVKKMATVHAQGGDFIVAVKGAARAVLEACSSVVPARPGQDSRPLDDKTRQHWTDRSSALARRGLRVLAVADKRVDSPEAPPYEGLRFLGLLALFDPPREGVKAAIDTCQAAGLQVKMVTGDQPETAESIARAVGIVGDADDPEAVVLRGNALKSLEGIDEARRQGIDRINIFARVSPEQKLNLVEVHQEVGEVVAMTGDGINDAPALKKADIGVAMGRRGTEAAKQAADMVLRDDAFATIVAAVAQGRVIFSNIRRSVMFMLCTNVAEVLAVTVATLAGWTLPLRPLQILYLNVITDVFPALALGVGVGSGQEMRQRPRDPREPLLTRQHWMEIGGWSSLIAVCVLAGVLLAEHWLRLTELEAVTVSFLTLAFGKLGFTFTLRSPNSGLVRNEITNNPWVWGAIGLCTALLVAAVRQPVLSDLLQTRSLVWPAWGLVIGLSLVVLAVGQGVRQLQQHFRTVSSDSAR